MSFQAFFWVHGRQLHIESLRAELGVRGSESGFTNRSRVLHVAFSPSMSSKSSRP